MNTLPVKNGAKLVGWMLVFSIFSFIALVATTRIKKNISKLFRGFTK